MSSARRSVVAFLLVAVNLRIAIAALSPVLDDVEHDEHLSSAAAGLLTSVPVICFGAFAFLTPRLTRHLGQHRLLGASMVMLAAGIVVRVVPGVPALYGGTLLVGAAIAVANVLMPALVKRDFSDRVAAVTGLYTMCLSVGAALSAGLTVPLRSATGWGWRPTLALWAIPAILAALAWAPQTRGRDPHTGHAVGPTLGPLLRDPVAWAVTLYMGVQSFGYYALLSWLPSLEKDHGLGVGPAGWVLSFASLAGIVASLVTPLLDRRLGHGPTVMLVGGALTLGSYVGLLVAPASLAFLWAGFAGLGQGASIALALGYIVMRSPDTAHAAQLSTMAQGMGYLIASLGPLSVGLLHAVNGAWTLPLIALIALGSVQLIAGVQASRARFVLAGREVAVR